jgi:hypothetical protein
MSDNDEPPPKKEKRKVTDKQMENLKKGMAVMKEKREALAKEREEFEAKKATGEIPADAPKPRFQPKPPKLQPKIVHTPPQPEEITVARKARQVKVRVAVESVPTKDDLASLKAEMLAAIQKPTPEPVIKEVPVEKVVDRVVHKERIVTGSEMLNQIFGLK